jgi:hypothetical protein
VARAKKTDRSEARRRARATAALATDAGDVAPGEEAASGQTGTAPAAGQRPGVISAFREAYQPVNFREDFRSLPWLITRTNAVWLPVALIVVSSIWYVASAGSVAEIATSRYGSLAGIAFSLLVAPPPIGSAFLAGVLAPRMSYLAGFIAGLAAFIAFAIVVAVAPAGAASALPPGLRESWILWGLSIGPVSGIVIGAFAGFYRRFLRRVNPNAGRRQQPAKTKNAKATARR